MYRTVRETFPLAAQMVVRCNAKVADAYKPGTHGSWVKATKRTFQPTGAIAYDERILRWQVGKSQVSIWTVRARITLFFVCGDRQRDLLATQQGETDSVLGIDFGIVELATDSEGNQHSGAAVKAVRRRVSRFTRWANHNISKRIVQTALSSRRAIAMESLMGIRALRWSLFRATRPAPALFVATAIKPTGKRNLNSLPLLVASQPMRT